MVNKTGFIKERGSSIGSKAKRLTADICGCHRMPGVKLITIFCRESGHYKIAHLKWLSSVSSLLRRKQSLVESHRFLVVFIRH